MALVTHGRWPLAEVIPEDGDWNVLPNLAVEVLSPHDLDQRVHEKLHEYVEAGVEQVWHVRPFINEILCYELIQYLKILRINNEIDGGELLPGLRIPLKQLFRRTFG